MAYRQLVQNKFGHRYHHFIEQNRKVSEPGDAPIKVYCWCGEIVEKV